MKVKITLVQLSKSLSFVSGLVIIADNGLRLGEGGIFSRNPLPKPLQI